MLAVMLLALFPTAFAADLAYSLIIEDNGNSLVILEITGNGLVNVPIMEDVSAVKVKGALYMLKEQSVDVSIGTTNSAVVLYKTMYLTKKEGDKWQLDFNLPSNKTNVLLPKNTIITKTVPNSFIEPGNYTKIAFENTDNITIEYSFDETIPEEEAKSGSIYLLVIGIIAGSVIGYIILKKPKISKKNDFLKTLSQNEKVVVKILMENNGSMKRNELEKKSSLAKSSLANTLNILEKKKILTIDKTYTTHFVKLEGWFNDL